MKKYAVVRIVICVVLLAVLVGALVWGMHLHRSGESWGTSLFRLGNVNIGGYTYKNSGDYAVGSGEISGASITELEIHWVSGQVQIAAGAGSAIVLEEDQGLAEGDQLRYLVSGNKLIIQYAGPRTGIYTLPENKILTVTLPQSLAKSMGEIEIETVSAELSVQGLSADSCQVDGVSGYSQILNCDFASLQVDTVSGACDFSSSVGELKMNSVSGQLTAELTVAPKEVDMSSVSGGVVLALPEGVGFTAEIDTVSGGLSCDLPLTKRGDLYIYGDGAVEIGMDSVSGDLEILSE